MIPYTGIPEQLGTNTSENRSEMSQAMEALRNVVDNPLLRPKLLEQIGRMIAVMTALDFADQNSMPQNPDLLTEYDRLSCWFIGFSNCCELLGFTSLTSDRSDYPLTQGPEGSYKVSANADQVKREGLDQLYEWYQVYTREGKVWNNRVYVPCEDQDSARDLYHRLGTLGMVRFRNWVD